MTYILHTIQADREQTRVFATAVDAVAALDVPGAALATIVSVDRMGEAISESELRGDAAREASRQEWHRPDVRVEGPPRPA